MTTHVFIVDNNTFPLHLEYLFAGTGAGEKTIDFNNREHTSLHTRVEDMLVEMIADASRIRRGDQIIFYLQQNLQQGIHEGKFYGTFRARLDGSFLDNNDGAQYLRPNLGKSLTFRTLIEPDQVYAEGVTEWEALDEIRDMSSPNQMLWSLIYRKLKGNRGNTMITMYESERLCQLMRNKNRRETLESNGRSLSFDSANQRIFARDQIPLQYGGRREELIILPRLLHKLRSERAFEKHLQAYIAMGIGRGVNQSLDNAVLRGRPIEWMGNEVGCGVGMRKIDIMLSLAQGAQRVVVPIELKSHNSDLTAARQLARYVEWIRQYYIPNRHSDIGPVLIARAYARKDSPQYEELLRSFREFNAANGHDCTRLKYIEFDVNNEGIVFEEIDYPNE